ncbi:MAG: efflux RND transporter periplasmic adaptor subunit [Pseudomonadota bacterium]
MAFPIRASHVLAIALAAGVGYYMYNGTTMRSGQGPIDPDNPVRASSANPEEAELFTVRARDFTEQERENALIVRGRTQADAEVAITAETGGRVTRVAVEEGDRVQAGDVLCLLDEAARRATLRQAQASLQQSTIELDAATSLADSGFGTQNQVPALLAAFNAAQAAFEQAEVELQRTVITAPIDGLVQLPVADLGSHLSSGELCATLFDVDPLVITVQVSERQIADIAEGVEAKIELVTGETLDGEVSFIAAAADEATRTFRVDIHVPNEKGTLRSGITADAHIQLEPIRGHLVPMSVLGLDDSGNVGVHTLSDDNTVSFVPIDILGDEAGGMWVGGLPNQAKIIVVGQEFVEDGQEVAVVMVEDGILQTSQAPLAPDDTQQGAAQ